MTIENLRGKLVAVLGYAQEGMAITSYLIKHGIKPVLFDIKPWQEWEDSEKQSIRNLGLTVIFGPGYLNELKGFDVAFRSPGISCLEPELIEQQRQGMLLTSQINWFMHHCPAKVIGVTGTKGKGTTTTLIHEMLKAHFEKSGKGRAYLTGNIGKQQPLEILDELEPNDWVAYEMSSFQLQDLDISPHIGVALMVTEDHLDYHKNLQEYRNAKEAIVKFQTEKDFAIINADYPASIEIGNKGKAKKYFVTLQGPVEFGSYLSGDTLYLSLNSEAAMPIVNISELKLRGRHNLENVSAASLAATLAGVSIVTIRQVLKNFSGLEHRLEFIGEFKGIKFYNDSFSTNPETAIAAIRAFSEPEILILGGSSKNSDFNDLGKAIAGANNIHAIIYIGQEGEKIKHAVENAGASNIKIMQNAKNMAEIFEQIKQVASEGAVVLLSPACASFGMFKNYKDRGEQFRSFAKQY